MDIERIDQALGLPFDDLAVQSIVKELGITGRPSAKKDDPDAYLETKNAGIALMFVDNDYMQRARVSRYGNAPMIFVSATLYSGRQTDDPAYRAYQGSLPSGIGFDDSVDQLISRLGPPTDVYEDEGTVFTRSWKGESSELSLAYNAAGTLEYIQLNWNTYMDRLD